mmetsp:Transcript_92859/g.174842  ORF Transcript_92859/g.174842 Transcript_92859/m.174842 type:complete len:111 (+) Transcript_92859:594-926(+)
MGSKRCRPFSFGCKEEKSINCLAIVPVRIHCVSGCSVLSNRQTIKERKGSNCRQHQPQLFFHRPRRQLRLLRLTPDLGFPAVRDRDFEALNGASQGKSPREAEEDPVLGT